MTSAHATPTASGRTSGRPVCCRSQPLAFAMTAPRIVCRSVHRTNSTRARTIERALPSNGGHPMTTLYQFEFSHFCEKARWALDYKGLAHERRNLLPGLHARVARKLASNSSLPILVDNGAVVQD